ncbi:MAG: cytochrome P450 [Sinobacteraceae bacterium]|nr:cytochrome P450 [Nevskiaceae bacterium]
MSYPTTLDSIRVNHPAPPHVPGDRIVDLSWAQGYIPNNLVDPYEPFHWLTGADIPSLLYAPPVPGVLAAAAGGSNEGSWAVTHYDDIKRVYTDNEHFSNRGTAEFQRLVGETFRSIPLAIDPPEHGSYRRFLMPHFSPSKLNALEAGMRAVVVEMMQGFSNTGEVDVAYDFGRIYPVRIFMALMGFPPPMLEQFLAWVWDILHSGSEESMAGAMRNVLEYLRSFMKEKEAHPDEHLVSQIVNGRIDGRPLTDDEKIGTVWFLWLGGLDTVAATISQMFRRMALQPDIQRTLQAKPELISGAVEEFLRTQPILSSQRRATKDFEWHGATIKQGESVLCLNCAGNFDPAYFRNPRDFDPTRKGNYHFTFVGGVHLCLGAPLARRELRILLEEWFKRIPEFRVRDGADTTVFPGLLSIRNLPLVWDVS